MALSIRVYTQLLIAVASVGILTGCSKGSTSAEATGRPAPVKEVQTVLTQSPAAHTVLHPGATVTLTMHHCPQ